IDPYDLLSSGVDAAGQDARFDRRAVPAGANDVAAVDTAMKAAQQAAAFGVRADEPEETRPAAQRGDVVGGVRRPASHHFGGVVFQDQDGRLARDARNLAIHELVRDQITDNEDAPARESLDKAQQALFALGLAGQRMDGTGDQHADFLR